MGDFEDKLAAKRAEAKAAQEKAQKEKELASAAKDAARQYTNPARKEDAVRRYQELRSPAVPVARPAASPPPPPQIPSGANINIEVWSMGESPSTYVLYRTPVNDYWIPVRNGLIQLPTVSRPTDTPAGLVDIRISNVSPSS